MIKNITFTLYAIAILVMAIATITEKTQGTPYVLSNIYGSWWFTALWALLAIGGIAYLFQRRIKRLAIILLHGSFLLILAGALLTHLTAWQGIIHLRKGEAVTYCYIEENGAQSPKKLPFTITLEDFNIRYHNGTETAADYESHLTIRTDTETEHGYTSMNNIYSTHGIRLYQSGYDDDMQGTT
ncbi:MAG: cytochrome c biogenesis protein ResB, partial [Bacteroidaceae bacterium]|nr:cytochrome c biogenesis protein ResB [Bacteroidaceae bacterium]